MPSNGEHNPTTAMRKPITGDEVRAPIEEDRFELPSYAPIISTVQAVRQRWRLTLGFPLLVAIITAGVSLIIPPTYSASIAFLPEAGAETRLPSGMSGLAGQLGITINRQASLSPQFYTSVMLNRILLEPVILSKYPDPRSSAQPNDSISLMPLLNVGGRNAADSLNNAIRKLRRRIAFRIENRTDIVYVGVEARYPTIAAAIANQLIELVNDFNATTRKSRAGKRREFLEERLAVRNERLREAENALQEFLEANRLWQQSPELLFAEGRLRRQVDIQQQVLITLMQEYETAGIEEVNDTPVITIIEPAVPPPRRARPRRKLMVLVSFFLGTILAVGWVFAADHLRYVNILSPKSRSTAIPHPTH